MPNSTKQNITQSDPICDKLRELANEIRLQNKKLYHIYFELKKL